jgi:predicted DNA-binding WGR domain protein
MARLVNTTGGSNKFWEGEVSAKELTTRWGAVGTNGQSKAESFESAAAAKVALEKKIKEKLGKGYVAAADEAPAKGLREPAPPATGAGDDSLTGRVTAKLRADGGGSGFGCDAYDKPRPLAADKLAKLTLPGGKPLSPSLRTWLAFAGSWDVPVTNRGELQHEAVSEIVARIFDAERSDDEEYFDAIDAEYPAGGFVLPQSAKQAHVLYLGVTDDAGEHPILGFVIAEGGWVKYPSFASFLADYFGVVPTKKQTGFADAQKAQTARLAKPKAKATAAAKPVKAARKKSDKELETALPPLSGGAADALAGLVAILAEAPSEALDAAIKRSHASVWDARGKFVDVREVLPSGAALLEALRGGSARLSNRASNWRIELPMEIAPLVAPGLAEPHLTRLAGDEQVGTSIRGTALTALGACPTESAAATLIDALFAAIPTVPFGGGERPDLRVLRGASWGLGSCRAPGVVEAATRGFDRWSRLPKANYEAGEELLSFLKGRKVPFTRPDQIASCLRATRREESEAFVGWRALHTLALPHVGDGVPADLRKLIKNEWDAELQPRMAEVARAFGVDPSLL